MTGCHGNHAFGGGVPMNNFAPIGKARGGVQGRLNWMPEYKHSQ